MLAIECRRVSKRFYYWDHRPASLREWLIRAVRRETAPAPRPAFTLHELDLSVARGESVALFGHNGSGKSTLLRLVAGIYAPTSGRIHTCGRLTAVIELGAGFHPELSGNDNVDLYGELMGLSRRELAERRPEIVAFAELEEFISMPVKYFSSGMKARLAFAVAVCGRPDVLLLDEVFAVGDRSFRERCLERIRAFHADGGTLVIASHDLETVRSLCSRAVWLERGRIRLEGTVDDVIAAYARDGRAPAALPRSAASSASS